MAQHSSTRPASPSNNHLINGGGDRILWSPLVHLPRNPPAGVSPRAEEEHIRKAMSAAKGNKGDAADNVRNAPKLVMAEDAGV